MPPDTVKKKCEKYEVTFCLSGVKIHIDWLVCHYEETGKKLPTTIEYWNGSDGIVMNWC